MAQQNITIGIADAGNGDTLFAAFTKVEANFTELYSDDAGDVNSVNGQTGTVVLDLDDIAEGSTNEYYTEAKVSANTSVAANTAKVGITTQQAADIVTNNAKVTDQTVTLTQGTNVTITGTYPNFTIASDDVVGAVNSVNGDTGVVVLDTDDIAEGSTNEYYTEAKVSANTSVAANTAKVSNATHSGDVTGSTTLTIAADAVDGTKIADDSIDSEHYVDGSIDTAHIADDQITYAKMGTEFTTAAVISASDVDFSSAQIFTKTLSAATTLTFSNVSTGMVKDLVIIGNFTLTLPASVKTISGTYDGTVSNLIQIVSTNGSTEQWATISQEA